MWHNQSGGALVARLIQKVFSSKEIWWKEETETEAFYSDQRNRKAEQVNHAAFEFTSNYLIFLKVVLGNRWLSQKNENFL